MTTAVLAAVFISSMALLIWKRLYVAYFIALMLLAWTWRFVSALYIDKKGPLYAIELFRDVGGGNSAVVLLLVYLLVFLVLAVVFRPSKVRRLAFLTPPDANSPAGRTNRRIADFVFATFGVLLVVMWIDMLRIGVIPLFAGMERWTYTLEYAGPAHRAFIEQANLICFLLGVFYAARVHHTGHPDNRFLYLLLAIFVYLLFAGNRFSAFYANGSFFVIPWGMVALKRRFGLALPPTTVRAGRRLWVRTVQFVAIVGGIVLVTYAVYRSYTVSRDLGPAARFYAEHRILVQQGELWWCTYERTFIRHDNDPAWAFRSIFVDPIDDPGRNSTIPLLMQFELGDSVHEILATGTQYSGGFPEVLFELLGPWLAFAGVALMTWIFGRLLFITLEAVATERYMSVIFALYVMYPFYLFHMSGMLNFLVNWKYGVKVAAFTTWKLFEGGRALVNREREAALAG